MVSRKGLGWKPNPPDQEDWDFSRLGLSSENLPHRVSLKENVSQVLNQKGTSSCVAQSLAGAIDILETSAGLPYIPASRLFMYYNARRFYGGHLSDSGTHIRTAVKGLQKFGVCDEMYWRFSTSVLNINRRPGWGPYMKAYQRKGGDYYVINHWGNSRSEAIQTALNNGYPVAFGTKVARTILANDGPEIIELPGPGDDIVGGHAMLIVGYEVLDGELLFEVLNSWGNGWRNGGYAWFSNDYIQWSKTRDLTIVRGWERIREKK